MDVVGLWLVLICITMLYGSGRWAFEAGSGSGASNAGRPLARFALFAFIMVVVRFLLLWTGIPGRWQTGKAPLSPLFDPRHFASDFGWGMMQSTGDLLVTSLCLVVLAMVFVRVTEPLRRKALDHVSILWQRTDRNSEPNAVPMSMRLSAALFMQGVVTIGLVLILSEAARRSVLDSTLDYFERSGLLPGPLVITIFTALLLWTFAVIFFSSRSVWISIELVGLNRFTTIFRLPMGISAVAAASVLLSVFFVLFGLHEQIEAPLVAIFILTSWMVAVYSPLGSDRVSDWLHLRSIVPSIVLVSVLLYPVFENGMTAERQLMMRAAAESFQEDVDARIEFAIGQVLNRADEIEIASDPRLAVTVDAVYFDSVARLVTQGELIDALGSHDITITIFDSTGHPLGRSVETGRPRSRADSDTADLDAFDLIFSMYVAAGDRGRLIERMTGDQGSDQFTFVGFRPIVNNDVRTGWLMVRAIPEANLRASARAFPRVLTPAGFYGNRMVDISVVEYQNGVLSKRIGPTFGQTILDFEIDSALNQTPVIWRTSTIRGQEHIELYVRPDLIDGKSLPADPFLGSKVRTIAVRRPEAGIFDHLYYMLRITLVGLMLGLPVYLIGIWWRISRGLLPARRVRFRDKVLNAFFVAGTLTIAATGVVGMQLLTNENNRAVEAPLRQHLERVEATLLSDAGNEELPYQVLERSNLDSLSARVGLDLNVYKLAELERSSRPQLVRERLISARIPIEAYEALFFDGFRDVTVNQSLGSYEFTAGYRALLDESGDPRYVLSLPTLPEQQQIEEDRARTMAYLFGALLVLVFVVMVTAVLLANTLARPIAVLRAGLEAVSEGRFERIGPADSRDEIADLVNTFNTMQSQLEDSQTLLANQERDLAWQEMARQVAHEIRNPLTPMKLAVQYLRREFFRIRQDGSSENLGDETSPASSTTGRMFGNDQFAERFKRTTETLVEQIDALANIADEFSSFGRLPEQTRSDTDLNEIVLAAVSLMRNESRAVIETNLTIGPLMVHVDVEAIRRILINLLKNAFQAIDNEHVGDIRVETETKLSEDGSCVAIARVIDNGHGIPRPLWTKIFVPSFSTKTSGTGLGLAIARKTIEDHGGEIGFDTEQGTGTTFWIRLTCASPADDPVKGQ